MRFFIQSLLIMLIGFSTASMGANETEVSEEDVIASIQNDTEITSTEKSNTRSKKKSKQQNPAELDALLEEDNEDLYTKGSGSTKGKKGAEEASIALRQSTIETTAITVGAQAGLKWRYDQINKILKDKYEGRLDSAINFRPFIFDEVILAPSILVTKANENFESETRMVKSSIQFIVDREAKIVSVPPTYRDYLIREYPGPRQIHPVLKPKTDTEQQIWKKNILKGWEIGVKQANDVFTDGLAQMVRDLEGRVNYRKMVSLKMVSPAALKITKRGVTFNDRSMNVGETIYEITDLANYTNLEEWRTAWLKSESKF